MPLHVQNCDPISWTILSPLGLLYGVVQVSCWPQKDVIQFRCSHSDNFGFLLMEKHEDKIVFFLNQFLNFGYVSYEILCVRYAFNILHSQLYAEKSRKLQYMQTQKLYNLINLQNFATVWVYFRSLWIIVSQFNQ